MTTSGLAAPPRATRQSGASLQPGPPTRPRFQARPRTSFRKVSAFSLLASLLAHLLLLLISPFAIRVGIPPGASSAGSAPQESTFGLEMIIAIPSETAPENPIETPRTSGPSPPAATAIPGRAAPQGAVGVPGGFQTPVGGGDTGPPARDALRPGYRDSRLYVAPPPFRDSNRAPEEVYREHLQARIDAVNDSLGVAASRNSTTRDWTFTDRSGRRWGLSPDGLHLGGVTIPDELVPRPTPTGDNQTRQAAEERIRQRDEIRRQEEDRARAEAREAARDDTREARERDAAGAAGN